MKLSYKLFASYLVVILVSLSVLALATSFIAPNFWQQMMYMDMDGEMWGTGNTGDMRGMWGMDGMMGQNAQALDAQLNANFRASVNNALLLAGSGAILTAIGVSWFISQRIVMPVRAMAGMSRHIADGHYGERLEMRTGDEFDELTESFNRMASALAETEAMRRQLLADVTHELKTPLASIKGYMEGLQDGILAPTAENFQLIHREAARLQRLVSDLQELSRVEAGQTNLHIQRLDIADLVQTTIDRLRPQYDEKGISLTVDLAPALPFVCADRDRTEQVLINLLGNALQYTPSEGEVRVNAAVQGRMMLVSVRDTGVGLKPEDRERIFQRFYRVDKSRSRASGGSGIGLTIARHIVEAQGGTIWAESSGLGQGSMFSFTLPLA